MPLELRPDKNVINITIWGQEIEVYANKPTASQVREYNSAIIGKKGLRIKKLFPVRLAFGRKLCSGFKPGELTFKGKPVEQDAGGLWKDTIEEECPQIFEALARLLLDNTSAESGIDDDDDKQDEGDEAGDKGGTPDSPTYP